MLVYVITCRLNSKRYVGISSRSDRFEKHCYNAQVGRKGALYNAIRKHGPDSFEYAVLRRCTNAKTAKKLECKYIAQLNTRPPHGYNLTDGGDGAIGYKQSRKARLRRAQWQRDRMRSVSLRARTSKALKGRKKSATHLANIAAALRGRRLSKRRRAQISKTLTGRVQSLETRLKRAATLRRIGHKPPPHAIEASRKYWKGRPKSAAHRAKISATLTGRLGRKHTMRSRRAQSLTRAAWWAHYRTTARYAATCRKMSRSRRAMLSRKNVA
jgi:group I intron endonuclease